MGKMVTAKLRSMNLCGETVNTRWGTVTFSPEGLASLEVDETDLQLLRNLNWLLEPATGTTAASPVKPEPEAPSANPEPTPKLAFDLTDEATSAGVRKRKR